MTTGLTRTDFESLGVAEPDLAEASGFWWLLAVLGVAAVVAGGILVAKPSHSLATLAVVLGIFVLIDGIVELVRAIRVPENRGLTVVAGVLGLVIGILLVRHPSGAVSLIGIAIGIWLVAAGVVRLVRALVLGVRPVLRTAIALLEIAVGIAVVSDPHIGYATLAVLMGIYLILNGIATLALALALRRVAAKTKG